MSLYDTYVLPRIIDLACGIPALAPARRSAVSEARGTLLEIGFGSGLNLPFLPDGVERVLAVDPSLGARGLARERVAAARCPVDYIGLDAAVIRAESQSADCALSTFTLCTIPEAVTALREVKRILKPGGKLMILEHGRAPDANVARWQDRLNPVQRFVCGGCNVNRDIAALVQAAGFRFQTLAQDYFPDMPRTHAYLYAGVALSC